MRAAGRYSTAACAPRRALGPPPPLPQPPPSPGHGVDAWQGREGHRRGPAPPVLFCYRQALPAAAAAVRRGAGAAREEGAQGGGAASTPVSLSLSSTPTKAGAGPASAGVPPLALVLHAACTVDALAPLRCPAGLVCSAAGACVRAWGVWAWVCVPSGPCVWKACLARAARVLEPHSRRLQRAGPPATPCRCPCCPSRRPARAARAAAAVAAADKAVAAEGGGAGAGARGGGGAAAHASAAADTPGEGRPVRARGWRVCAVCGVFAGAAGRLLLHPAWVGLSPTQPGWRAYACACTTLTEHRVRSCLPRRQAGVRAAVRGDGAEDAGVRAHERGAGAAGLEDAAGRAPAAGRAGARCAAPMRLLPVLAWHGLATPAAGLRRGLLRRARAATAPWQPALVRGQNIAPCDTIANTLPPAPLPQYAGLTASEWLSAVQALLSSIREASGTS